MKSTFFALAAVTVLVLNAVGFGLFGGPSGSRQSTALIGILPESDVVVGIDARRFFNESMPQILASNQPMLTGIMTQLNEIKDKTGIDLRRFDSVAVGMSMIKVKEKEYDFDPVAVARGDVNAGALIAVAKLASNGKYREEKVGEHTIYVFSAKSAKVAAAKTAPKGGPAVDSMVDKAFDGLMKEIAVTSLDANTIALGSLARVRATVEGSTRISAEVAGLLAGKENTVMSFAMRSPEGMSKMLPLDNDELGSNIDSIKYVSGAMDVTAAGASLNVNAQTLKAEQAKGLSETLEGLQMLGKAFLGSSKRADQKIYARLIESAKISRVENNVSLDLLVAQADIDFLIKSIK